MERDNRKKSVQLRATLTALLLSLVMGLFAPWSLQPMTVYAEGETEVSSEQTAETSEPAEKSGTAETAETAEIEEPVKTVKCKSGTPVLPIGDLEAKTPKITAKGAAMYSLDLDKFVYTKNENKRIDPYSTTKLLTCWLALEMLDLDKTVTISEKATQVYENGTTIWLKPGEKITIRDLIYGALLASGNDAAYALGEAVSGSEKSFAELMNKTVEEWGCKDTHFVNANGWKNKKHFTTAHDLAIITVKCLENQELRKMSVTKKYVIPETNLTGARELSNFFIQVTESPKNVTGGKTGTWDEDDCSIVLSFKRKGLEAVIVLLGDTKKSRSKDASRLMKFSHKVTPGFEVPAADSTVETAWIRHGERTRAALTVDKVTYVYPASNKARDIRTEITHDKLEAPLRKGDEVGTFKVYTGDKLISTHKLIMAEDVETGWFPSYIYISNKATKALLGVKIGLVLIILLLSRMASRNRSKELSTADAVAASAESKTTRNSSRKEKKEARRKLREKYRDKH